MRGERKPGGDLPIGEALHPVALVALVVPVVNDWVLKPSSAPAWLTGKLSDVAGLVFAPLVLTALVDLALYAAARLGARVDPWLGPRRLAVAIALTGGVFAAVKISADVARAVARAWPGDARIVADRTDLLALPALAIAAWIGWREIQRTRCASDPTPARAGRP